MDQTVTSPIRSEASASSVLQLEPSERAELWSVLVRTIEEYLESLRERTVRRGFDAGEVRAHLREADFESPWDPGEVELHMIRQLAGRFGFDADTAEGSFKPPKMKE